MDTQKHIVIYRYSNIDNARHIWTLANCIKENGFQVTIVCAESSGSSIPGLDPEIKLAGLQADKKDGKLSRQFAAGNGLASALNGQSFDILYVIDSWSLISMAIATKLGMRWGNAKIIYHTFDWLEPGLVSSLHTFMEKRICRKADLVVNTDRSRARLQRTVYSLKETPLTVQNSLSIKDKIPAENASIRQELAKNMPADSILLIYPTVVSNATSSERMTYELINALSLLPGNYRLILFYKEGSEYDRCAALVKEKDLTDRVVFKNPVSYDKLIEYLVSSDLGFILYDDSKSSGYFMCNADKLSLLIASGTPYVASNFPNLESVTYKHKLGLCCDPKGPAQLSNAILKLTSDKADLNKKKQHVRDVFEKQLCFEKQSDTLINALKNI